VLYPCCLSSGSCYTNGQYLVVVIPPPNATLFGYTSSTFVCRTFRLKDGVFMGNYSLDTPPIGSCATYDAVNNIIWTYYARNTEVGIYYNSGLAPQHVLVDPNDATHPSDQLLLNRLARPEVNLLTRHSSLLEASSVLLRIVARLAVHAMPPHGQRVSPTLKRTADPFCVELHCDTFRRLYDVLYFAREQLDRSTASLADTPSDSSDDGELEAELDAASSRRPPPHEGSLLFWMNVIADCLRILKVNVHRLVLCGIEPDKMSGSDKPLSPSLTAFRGIKMTELLFRIRDMMLEFINNTTKLSESMTFEQLQHLYFLRLEACETLTVGLGLFYPTYVAQARLLLNLLSLVDHSSAASSNSSSTVANAASTSSTTASTWTTIASMVPQANGGQVAATNSPPHANRYIGIVTNSGYRLLVDALLNLLADHPSASYLVLPPSAAELGRNTVSGLSAFSFDPNYVFIPIVKRLFREAQSRRSSSHRRGTSQARSSSSSSSATPSSSASRTPVASLQQPTPAPSTGTSSSNAMASSPAMRLLIAIQRHLLLRVEESRSDSGPEAQALLTYTRHVIKESVSAMEHALATASKKTVGDKMANFVLKDKRSVVIRTLLPSLVNSLHLFENTWLAKEALSSIIELIDVLDRVNHVLLHTSPSALKNLHRSFSREFMDGPTRVYESLHPYEPYLDTTHVISIPGAMFLTIRFDPRCATVVGEDMLQLYTTTRMKRPIGEPLHGDSWPRHRVLVPGDTVVFSFRSRDATARCWGFRCVIIGHMSRSHDALPWSTQLERALCGLGGQFASLLIRGDPLSELERDYASLFAQPLLRYGVEDAHLPVRLSEPSTGGGGGERTIATAAAIASASASSAATATIPPLSMRHNSGSSNQSGSTPTSPTSASAAAYRESSSSNLTGSGSAGAFTDINGDHHHHHHAHQPFHHLHHSSSEYGANNSSYASSSTSGATSDPELDASSTDNKRNVQHDEFLEDLFHRRGTTDGAMFADWILVELRERCHTTRLQQFQCVFQAERATLAALLKHMGLIEEALNLAKACRKAAASRKSTSIGKTSGQSVRKFPRSQSIGSSFPAQPLSAAAAAAPSTPPPMSSTVDGSGELPPLSNVAQFSKSQRGEALLALLLPPLRKLIDGILLKHQEMQFACAIESEINAVTMRTNQPASSSNLTMLSRENAYRVITDAAKEKAKFLLKVRYSGEASANDVVAFVLAPVPLDTIKLGLLQRCRRAVSRFHGFAYMRAILQCARYPVMKHETLCFLGPALRHGANLVAPTWRSHYLDYLEGAGVLLCSKVRSSFMTLMSSVGALLRDRSCDTAAQLLALDSWVMNFKHYDQSFLHNVDIFNSSYHSHSHSHSHSISCLAN